MGKRGYQFQPDYAVPPGWVLEERLEANGISQAEFARRCGRSAKFISEVVAGKAPVDAKTALQFEKVSGVSANIWLGIEKRFRLHRMREQEAREAEASAEWARGFPVSELARRGATRRVKSGGETVTELLTFFGVASVQAWRNRYAAMTVAYRHSPSFESRAPSLSAWLRLAEVEAEAQAVQDYDKTSFVAALKEIRQLTRAELPGALRQARRLCNDAGVALVWVKPLPKAHVSGAAWWLSPRKPVIALSGRHLADDQIWFSLFHEAAHILLHGKRSYFVDDGKTGNGDEAQADRWAGNFLVAHSAWRRFIDAGRFDAPHVQAFAAQQRIAPGIVVGRLQREEHLPWAALNELKTRTKWSQDGSRLCAAGGRSQGRPGPDTST